MQTFVLIDTDRVRELHIDVGVPHHLGNILDGNTALMGPGGKGSAKRQPIRTRHARGIASRVDIPPEDVVAVLRLSAPRWKNEIGRLGSFGFALPLQKERQHRGQRRTCERRSRHGRLKAERRAPAPRPPSFQKDLS